MQNDPNSRWYALGWEAAASLALSASSLASALRFDTRAGPVGDACAVLVGKTAGFWRAKAERELDGGTDPEVVRMVCLCSGLSFPRLVSR